MNYPATRFFWLIVPLLFQFTARAQQQWPLQFDLGGQAHRAGYTQVLPGTVYNDQVGYGFDLGTNPSAPPFYFSVRVPEGNYNVTVTLGDKNAPTTTTIKAECRRLMVEKVTTAKGKFTTCRFTVHVRDSIIRENGMTRPVRLKSREYAYLHWDNKLTLEFGNTAPVVSAIEITPVADIPTVFLAGNSTVVDQAEEPWAAWGQMIPAFFQPGKVAIANYAESGETLKAFVGERRLAKLWSMAHRGDYLFIEFAHNDQKQGANHLDPFTTYKAELAWYISEARHRGMIPVLVTSMHRRNFDPTGHIVNTLGDYPAAMRELAKDSSVACIDLNAMSRQLYEAWGPEQSIHAFVHYPAHTFPGQDQELKDDTHFNAYGAYELARCVSEGIRDQVPALAKDLKVDLPRFDPAHPDALADFHLPMSGRVAVRRPDGDVDAGNASLQWPAISAQTKPWTRWWWMGSAVDKKNLSLNMEQYQAAGLGGLELTPIYGVKGYEHQFINYLSPEWMDLFGYTLQEASRLGLGIDMSTGTGWPFGGGPLIDSAYACREMFYKTWTVKAGGTLADTIHFLQEPLVRTDGRPTTIDQLQEPVFSNKDLQALALFQVRFNRLLPLQSLMAYSSTGTTVDLTGKVDATGRLQWKAPANSGDWTLYGVFLGWHGKMVERAAPGAEGNVIDHFSSAALKKYLSRFDTAFAGHTLSPLRCFFNDSYEVDDARGQSNWTAGFFQTFQQHRGYDLREHLPALFGKDTKENNARILCDYRETISDLLLEQFTMPWAEWAHSKGAKIRNQAHGSPANILDLYAASDIPETEGGEILRYKFGTSAAHVTGKPLASSESVTWLGEHFTSTLSDVKKAVDQYLLGGVNHIFYHGTAYTPMNDPWPGWLFYASVHFTPNDPAWQDFSVLNQYIARCQSFLQQGAPDNDILLYYPLYDSWMDPGAALLKHYDRMEPEFQGSGFEACAQLMQDKGYAFDYISDRQLQLTNTAGDGSAEIVSSGGSHYKTVLLPDCRYISAAAFTRLVRMAEEGATILVYKALPSDVPGYHDHGQRGDSLRQLLSRLSFSDVPGAGIRQAMVGKGRFLVGDDLSRLLDHTGVRREGMVDDSLSYVRRKYGDGHVYFIVNQGRKEWKGHIHPAVDFKGAAIFNAMNGRSGLAIQRLEGRGTADSGPWIELDLMPGESCLVQTSANAQRGALYEYMIPVGKPVALQGKWKIRFSEGGPRLPATTTSDQPTYWTALPDEDVKSFSGTAVYATTFSRPAPTGNPTYWLLDLGKVNETAEVLINGKKMGALIGPYYQLYIPVSLLQEQNTLEVSVSSGMLNRIEDLDRKGVFWKKFYNTNFPAHDRANRGANGLFDASKMTPVASGLDGPVTLTPVQQLLPGRKQ